MISHILIKGSDNNDMVELGTYGTVESKSNCEREKEKNELDFDVDELDSKMPFFFKNKSIFIKDLENIKEEDDSNFEMDEKIYIDLQGFLKNEHGAPILDEQKQHIFFDNKHHSLFLRK